MDLIEIGTALREGRESKGLTVEAVEEKTKIAPSVIVALEEGNSSRFPHPVYARGFIRSYALLLGLDAQELCAHFSREYPVPKDSDQPEAHAPQIRVKMHDSGSLSNVVRIAAILGIVLLGALGWYAYEQYASRSVPESIPVQEAAPPVAPSETRSSESLPAPMTQMQEVAATPGADAALNASSGDTANATQSAPLADVSAQAEQPAAATQGVDQEPPVEQERIADTVVEPAPSRPDAGSAAGTRSMRISAHSASWLQARPDDKVLDYFLRKGESTTITFDSSLSIKFGNAGGVTLELDGQPYPFEGALGEVKTLVVE
jgi:cytoskeleton protein RodZ